MALALQVRPAPSALKSQLAGFGRLAVGSQGSTDEDLTLMSRPH